MCFMSKWVQTSPGFLFKLFEQVSKTNATKKKKSRTTVIPVLSEIKEEVLFRKSSLTDCELHRRAVAALSSGMLDAQQVH